MDLTLLIPVSLIAALGYIVYVTMNINRQPIETERMKEIYNAIRIGSKAYIRRQYTTITIVIVLLAAVFYMTIDGFGRFPYVAFAFLLGAACSLVSGYIGMDTATRSNARTTTLARKSVREALLFAFDGGMVIGLCVVGLSLLAVTALYYLYGGDPHLTPSLIVGLGFGASLAALFAQLGGGIYTKAADVGADLVGKIEAGIPEDDPRNPAVIADNVGDNVGDAAGREADLFESHTGENIGSMIVGVAIFLITKNIYFVLFPLIGTAIAILATIISIPVIKLTKSKDPLAPLRNGLISVTILSAISLFFAVTYMFNDLNLYLATLTGLVASVLMYFITEYYTSSKHRPVREIAESSTAGPGVTLISGLSVGLECTALPIITLSVALLFAFYLGSTSTVAVSVGSFAAGIYGTAIATRGILSACGMILALDGFGPIVDNAAGIAEMSGAGEEIKSSIDALDAVGNTTKALTKGYAMGSAALSAFLLFRAYSDVVGLNVVNVTKPVVLIGAFIGALLPFLFSSFAIKGVRKAAFGIVNEVRRQFKTIPGLMEGKAKPDYSTCIDISTRVSLREMIAPSLIALIAPISVGFLLGPEAIGALLIAATITGIPLAMLMNTGGGAFDNAKKFIEDGHFGGKGSPAHAAAVVGDTVGDPLKDTAGPSLHVLVKMLNTLALVFGPLFVAYYLITL